MSILITRIPYPYPSCVRINPQYKHMYPPVETHEETKSGGPSDETAKTEVLVTAGVAR